MADPHAHERAQRPAALAERVLILDFGAQYTQLIARRVREHGVYCEIRPCNLRGDDPRLRAQSASSSRAARPASDARGSATCDPRRVRAGRAGAGHLLRHADYVRTSSAARSSGRPPRVRPRRRRRGRPTAPLFDGVWPSGATRPVWMSHGDQRRRAAAGLPRRRRDAGARRSRRSPTTRGRSTAPVPSRGRAHAATAASCCATSSSASCGCRGDWTMAALPRRAIAAMREQVGQGRVICGLSGGVDSSVAAVLVHEAIGDQLDLHLRRQRPAAPGRGRAGRAHASATASTSSSCSSTRAERFLDALAGVGDPEQKRKIIGAIFIDVFERRGQDASAAPTSWPRARSTRTSSSRSRSRARRRRSRSTTTSAACPSA